MRKTKKAFTIVELVIVIAVIAILMSIMFVGGRAITNNAKVSTLDSDFRTFETNIKAMINDPDNSDLEMNISDDVVKTWVNSYFEDELAIGDFEDVAIASTGSAVASYEAATGLEDPFGKDYKLVVLDNSTVNHTDLSFCVYSFGENKQTSTTTGAWDKDDYVVIVRVFDSVIYTEEIADLSADTAYQTAVNDAFATVLDDSVVAGDFS